MALESDRVSDGFPGQVLISLPRPTVDAALHRPGTSHVVVTDCGYFPEARAHGMSRPAPIDQAIVAICTSGRGWCALGGKRHRVTAGQVFVVPPGFAHSYGADAERPWTLWWMHVAGRDVLELLRSGGVTSAAPVRDVADPYRMVALIEEIIRTIAVDPGASNLLAASGAAWHLLAVLLASSRPAGSRQSPVELARDYIRSNVAEQLTVAALARMANLSASHFAAEFRRRFGVSPLRYQTDLRMARAREMLDTTERTVAEIALLVGYPDRAYFSRQFSAVHGVSPRSFRARLKG